MIMPAAECNPGFRFGPASGEQSTSGYGASGG